MARIRILQAIGGLDFSWAPGELVDLDDEEAAKWADGVRAEPAPEAVTHADLERRMAQGIVSPDTFAQQLADQAPRTGDDPPEPPTPTDPDRAPEAFDPAQHSVKDVVAYLDGVGEEEAMRVLQQEDSAENPRKGIAGQRETILDRARANDQERVEKTAEASRGGGRGDGIETR